MTQRTDHFRRAAASHKRDMIVAGACGAFVACMVGMSFAAVPLYDWFCRTTGFNGTTQVASQGPNTVLDQKIVVRFDSNVGGGLPWRFEPEHNTVEVKLGEVVTFNYLVTNLSARETMGVAAYNVAPLSVGAYFQKINCFCFNEQKLKPGEKREMPVVFFVDPALAQDAEASALRTITLSYTFYPQREPQRPVAETRAGGPGASKL